MPENTISSRKGKVLVWLTRYYDPSQGRFLSRDTWAYNYQNPIELNRYGYTANNPVNFSDPSGNQTTAGYAIKNKFNLVVYRVANKATYGWTERFAMGMLGGSAGWAMGKAIGIAMKYGISNIIQGFENLGYSGNNDITYELWAASGIAIDFLWSGLLGGFIEIGGAFMDEYNMIFLSAEEVMAVNTITQSMKITFVASLVNFIKPLIDNFFSVIPFGASTANPTLDDAFGMLRKEILSDFVVEAVSIIFSTSAVGASVALSNSLTNLARRTGIPGSNAFFSMLTSGIVSGFAVASRDFVDDRL